MRCTIKYKAIYYVLKLILIIINKCKINFKIKNAETLNYSY